MDKLNGNFFWKQVDELNPYKSIKMLMDKSSIDYNTIKKQRSELRFPKIEIILAIANELNCSLDLLLERDFKPSQITYPKRIKAIADKLCNVSEMDLSLIERSVELLPLEEQSVKVNVG